MRRGPTFLIALVLIVATSAMAYAQGGSTKSSISGVVLDSSGGAIPGATVVIKNTDTGVSFQVVTNSAGAFAVPSLDPGVYSVTTSLSGFKTSVTNNMKLIAAQPATLKISLEVGSLSETVVVKGASELVNTTTSTVQSTLQTDQLKNLPLPTHNALYAVTMLPGVDTTGTQSPRNSTISGLPQASINITLDGVNVSNNMQRTSDGFYAMVFPQLDAIEEVTLTTATQGADSAGQGAVQVRFVTKSGTNQFRGTGYNYFRHPDLNSNYYFNTVNNLPRNRIIANQFGISEGGPIVIPGLVDGHGRAFFFHNWEEFHQPTAATRNATLINPQTAQGQFQYNVANAVTSLNLYSMATQFAAANPSLSAAVLAANSPDPTIAALIAQMATGAGKTGTITQATDPNALSYVFQSPGNYIQHLPTTKVDFNLTAKHRLSGTYLWQVNNRLPDIQNTGDAVVPGLPQFGTYKSKRTTGSITLRSTLSSSFINELIGGWQWSPSRFGWGVKPEQFVNQGGFSLGFPGNFSNATRTNSFEDPRNTPNWNIDDNFTWLHKSHSIAAGVSFTQILQIDVAGNAVPTISFGVQTGLDPIDGMFAPANFPGASTNDINNARGIYSFLTGRVTQVGATGRLNDVTNLYGYPPGTSNDHMKLNEWGTYVQDTWRVSPTLTLNGGLRWEIQMPIQALNASYSTATLADLCGISGVGTGPGGRTCNLFQSGTLTGIAAPQFIQYAPNTNGYKTAWGNVAPNVGVAWRPNAQSGVMRTILGDPDQATVRGGYSMTYNRSGMDEFTGIYGNNPGRTTGANRNFNNGNLTTTWPLLFSNASALGPPATCAQGANPVPVNCMAYSPVFPQTLALNSTQSINIFNPDIHISHVNSYSVGLQRALNKDIVVEASYVGTRLIDGWTTENWNQLNVYENGFLDEFKKAQRNLLANMAYVTANGTLPDGSTAPSFKYYPAIAGSSPLPIFLAHYNGLAGCVSAGCPGANTTANYTGVNWTNAANIQNLTVLNANSGTVGSFTTNGQTGLYGFATFRANGRAVGLPVNFWVMNPFAGNANIRTNAGQTKYDSLQLTFRTRLTHGLQAQANFVHAVRKTAVLDDLHFPYSLVDDTSGVPNAFKWNLTYDLPFGRGKRFGGNWNPWIDGALGNWSYAMTGRLQSGNVRTLSGVKLVNMTVKDLEKEFYIRVDPVTKIVTDMDADIILNTRRAFGTDATSATGYSALGVPTGRYIAPASYLGDCVAFVPTDCGEPRRISITGPMFTDIDMSIKKRFPLNKKGMVFTLEADFTNIFAAVNFTTVLQANNSATQDQVTAAYSDVGNTFYPGGRVGQIVFRINW